MRTLDVGRHVADGITGAAEAHADLTEGVDAFAQRARQHLGQLRQRRHGGLAERRVGGPRQVAQRHGDGDGFVVVEQQRGQPAAGAEGVAAVAARRALDRVAEVAQPGRRRAAACGS